MSTPPQGQKQLYEGKAKIIYETDEPAVLLSWYKDDATAFNAQKRGQIVGKGTINCTISSHLFKLLESHGIQTHWIDQPSDNTMRVQAVTIVPLEVVVRNVAAGSLCRQTGIDVGTVLDPPLVEFYYKNDDLGDPLLTGDRILAMGLATLETLDELETLARRIDEILTGFFEQCGITLVDFKLEFGRNNQGELLLADEISPDTCRLWDIAEADTNKRVMDKDRFRHDLGDIESAYQAVLTRVLSTISPAN